MRISTLWRYVFPFVLFIVSVLYNLYLIGSPVGVLDEGIVLSGAQRVSNGEFPVADFWDIYPPGQYLVISGLFKLFGESILTERVYDIIVRSLLSLVVFWSILYIASSYWSALLGWFVVMVSLGSIEFSGYPVYPSLLFVVISGYYLSLYFDNNKLYTVVVAGLCISISATFRHDIGGMMGIVSVSVLLYSHRKFGPFVCFVTGMIAVFGVMLWKWLSVADIETIVNQMVILPAALMPKYRWLPYPGLDSIKSMPFYFYPLILILGMVVSITAFVRSSLHRRLRYGMLLFAAVGLLYMRLAIVRSDYVHFIPVLTIAAIVGGLMLSSHVIQYVSSGNSRLGRLYSGLILMLVIAPVVLPFMRKCETFNDGYLSLLSHQEWTSLSRVSEDLKSVVDYVERNSIDTDYLYVGVTDHDQFVGNETIIYFLSNRRYASKYHQLVPGVTSLPDTQHEIVCELDLNCPKFVILSRMFWYEPNLSQVDTDVNIIDDYIRRNYSECVRYGRYGVWCRLDNRCIDDEM